MFGLKTFRHYLLGQTFLLTIERAHGTINAIFAKMVNSDLKDWDEMAPYVTFAYNNSKHTSTTFTPFYLTYMREARVSLDLLLDLGVSTYRSTDEYADLVKVRMNKAYEIVAAMQKVVFKRAKKRYDARVKAASFDVGDYVYYFSPKMAPGGGRKFQKLTTGPWKVEKKINSVNYVIVRVSTGRKIIVHIDRITKYHQRPALASETGAATEITPEKQILTPTRPLRNRREPKRYSPQP